MSNFTRLRRRITLLRVFTEPLRIPAGFSVHPFRFRVRIGVTSPSLAPMPLPYQTERDLAFHAVLAATHLCEQVRRDQATQAFAKPDHSPVTIADYATQALICHHLTSARPDDAIVGEEDAQVLATPEMRPCLDQVVQYLRPSLPTITAQQVLDQVSQGQAQPGYRFWTVDPIDGTKGYVRGDQYAIALALIENGQLQVAAMACPALPVDPQHPQGDRGVIFLAVRGQGSQAIEITGGKRSSLQVNQTPRQGSFCLIESVERDHGTPQWQYAVIQALGWTAPPLQMDSLAKYGAIARGEADLYLRLPTGASTQRHENIWDHAAGVLVLEEAGGQVTDQWGQPLDFSQGRKLSQNQGIVASNGVMHSAIVAAIQTTTPQNP